MVKFFEKFRLSLRQWLVLFYCWFREYPVTDAAEEAEVEKKSAVQAYQYCRDICSWRLLHHDSPLLLHTSATIVHSDQCAAYNHVQQLPSVTTHSTVNHLLHFIDPGTGIHTQNVESYWNRVKGKFKRMKGVHEEIISLYVDEFMCRERHGPTASTVLTNLCCDIYQRYHQ